MANVDLGGHYKRLVRLFWDPEPKNDESPQIPIWCLGQRYNAPGGSETTDKEKERQHRDSDTVVLPEDLPPGPLRSCDPAGGSIVPALASEEDRGWPAEFLDDFEARFWFTYRSHFPPIQKSLDSSAASTLTLAVRLRNQLVDQGGFTSDAGFGCMIRSGQCLLANALAILKFGRDWRRGSMPAEERELLSLFADDPRAPFSLHRFIDHGASCCGKHPGEWFGPSATASCIEALSHQYPLSGLRVYVTADGADVYQDSLLDQARDSNGNFRPVLILAGIRLGIERVTPVYWEALATSLKLPQSVGIAGGRPSASHYFVGVQGQSFFYLDPHQTRPMLPYYETGAEMVPDDVASCHTRRLRRLHVGQMDPSMLLAFLITSEQDWAKWKNAMYTSPGSSILRVADKKPTYHKDALDGSNSIDQVETLDDDYSESDGELVEVGQQDGTRSFKGT